MKKKFAFFDICHTLVGVTTIRDFTEGYLLSPRLNPKFKPSKVFSYYLSKVRRKLGFVPSDGASDSPYHRLFAGYSEADLAPLYDAYARRLSGKLIPDIKGRFDKLRAEGYEIMLVTAGLEEYLAPFARELGVPLLASVLEKDASGRYTGRLAGIECVGEGKAAKIRGATEGTDVDWEASFAFGDDDSDMPMLSLVGRPCAVDPQEKLRAHAAAHGWEITDTCERGMLFVIRDDDLNYFDSPENIEKWYAPLFAEGIPVGFSAVPFVKPTSDAWLPPLPQEDKEYAISGNQKLVEYVRGNPLIEILQHGCTHETKNGVFEYRRTEGLFGETLRGHQELTRAFGQAPAVFVPPHDAISNHGILAVESCGMDIVRGTGSKNFLFRKKYFGAFPSMVAHRLRFPEKSSMPAYPRTLDLGFHKEAYSQRLKEDNLEYLLKSLRFAHARKANFAVTNHFAVTTEKEMQNLSALVAEARKLGYAFAKPSALFARTCHD